LTLQDIQALDVGAIADSPAFVFLWKDPAPSLVNMTASHACRSGYESQRPRLVLAPLHLPFKAELDIWPSARAVSSRPAADVLKYSVLQHCIPCGRCGSAEGLDAGRHCLRKWGFRRCEDICWIKTNKDASRKYMLQQDPHNCIIHTKVRSLLFPLNCCCPCTILQHQRCSKTLCYGSWAGINAVCKCGHRGSGRHSCNVTQCQSHNVNGWLQLFDI